MPTKDDEIVKEVRRIRDNHAAAYDYDLARIVKGLREQEQASNGTFVTLEPKKPMPLPRASGA